ncbi:hypothetical protein ACFL45_01040 [Candidatus Neomarinimicrobiota bacterium]
MKTSPVSRFAIAVLPVCLIMSTVLGALPGRQVITSAELRGAGITRISGLLWLADNWHLSTIDGYTWRAAVNGLNTFDDQAWTVLLDGQRMNLKTMDVVNLNALPIDLTQIDSVIIISTPRLHHGEFTDKGLIHIHTRRPDPGLSAQGHYFAGNEAGDPGPYLYTRYRTPNVDRIGFDESLSINAARDSWSARFFLLWQTHTFSDFALTRRVKSTINEWSGLNLWSALCRFGLVTARGEHELIAGCSFGDAHRVFFNPLGREIPVIDLSPRFGMNGRLPSLFGNLDVSYRLQFSRNTLRKSTNLLNFDYDYSLQNIHAALMGEFQGSSSGGNIGVGVDHYLFNTSPDLLSPSYMIGRFFGEIHATTSRRFQPSLGAMLLTSNGRAALKTSLSNLWEVSSRNSISATLAFSQRLLEEDTTPWYWIRQGYRLYDDHDVEYGISGNLDQSTRITADVAWSLVLGKNLTAAAAVFYRHLDGLYLERLAYQYVPEVCAFISPVSLLGDLHGKIGGISITLSQSPRRDLSQRLSYMYQTSLGGDQDFSAAQNAIPEHKASYRVTWAPLDNIAVWAMISYRSSSSYYAYQDAGSQICPLTNLINLVYSPALKSTTVFDLSMKKWFWKRRISGQVLLRNIMNEDLRYHPVGAGFGLSMLIQVNVLLDATDRSTRHDTG